MKKERKDICIYVVLVICTTSSGKEKEKKIYIVILTIAPPPFGEMIVPIIKSGNYTDAEERKRKNMK
jgi:hypothetical protein